MATTKFVSVRIRVDQNETLKQFADMNYSAVNKLVQQATDNFINDEIPVLTQAIEQARKKMKRR